jgi:hypothetical protein
MSTFANKKPASLSAATLVTSKPIQKLTGNAQTISAPPDSKQSRIIAMLREPNGATLTAMMKATGWQKHSVRGFLTAVVRKRLKLQLTSKKEDGNRIYQIMGAKAAGSKRRRPKIRPR